jgi:ABC-2 type transport system permease protein
MRKNIFKHEFNMISKSVITWCVAVTAVLFLMVGLFSSFAEDADLLNETMAQMPPELLTAFGMTGLDLGTVLGFFSFAFLFVQICLAIQAANYGVAMVSVEERDMTADFLLVKPVSRTEILTSKFLAALAGLMITNAVVWVVSFGAITLFKGDQSYEVQPLVLLLLSNVVFQLFFLTVGILISLLMKRVRSVTSVSMGLAFGMYVLSAFGGMLGEDSFDLITPFKHFEPNYIISNGGYDLPLVLISVAVIVISVVASYRLYLTRNIQTAM